MRVLVACEFSGVVREAFRARGHDAWSCDLLPCDGDDRHHLRANVTNILDEGWDMMIAHPPCTYLCSSGLHWNKRVAGRSHYTEMALQFVGFLLGASIPKIALENPVGCISSRIRKPNQIIQPWMFGHPESKTTCLWLKNLPVLAPTNVLPKPEGGRWSNQTPSGQNKLGPSENRWRLRSVTYKGVAEAMAEQWSMPPTVSRANAAESPSARAASSTTQTAPVPDQTARTDP